MGRLIFTLALLAFFICTAPVARASTLMPNVLEMFTSNVCPTCPKANKDLIAMERIPGRLTLSYHVNIYGNRKINDPFILEEANARQRGYNHIKQTNMRFTPHMVLNGEHHMNGASTFQTAWNLLRHEKDNLPNVSATLTDKDGFYTLSFEESKVSGPKDLWAIHYLKEDKASTKHHSVTKAYKIGLWHGEKVLFVIPTPESEAESLAILVQEPDYGPIDFAVLP